jgi:hypothetical protein
VWGQPDLWYRGHTWRGANSADSRENLFHLAALLELA